MTISERGSISADEVRLRKIISELGATISVRAADIGDDEWQLDQDGVLLLSKDTLRELLNHISGGRTDAR